MTGVITKLLETTHGQWLYRCVQVHDRFSGIQATQRKEELQMAIEAQQDMGWEDLTEEDQYLAEVNLEDLEHTSGERQVLLAFLLDNFRLSTHQVDCCIHFIIKIADVCFSTCHTTLPIPPPKLSRSFGRVESPILKANLLSAA